MKSTKLQKTLAMFLVSLTMISLGLSIFEKDVKQIEATRENTVNVSVEK